MSAFADSRIYGLDEICELLSAVDRHLQTPVALVVIGGAAAAYHGAASTTTDVDTFEALGAELRRAIELAKAETGLDIAVNHSPVADVPWNYEDRLERKLPELQHLQIRVLEKHDLALSKAIRCDEHDLQQLAELHAVNALDFDVLVARFHSEMTHAMGDPRRRLVNFLYLIERLFGELRRVQAERSLGWAR